MNGREASPQWVGTTWALESRDLTASNWAFSFQSLPFPLLSELLRERRVIRRAFGPFRCGFGSGSRSAAGRGGDSDLTSPSQVTIVEGKSLRRQSLVASNAFGRCGRRIRGVKSADFPLLSGATAPRGGQFRRRRIGGVELWENALLFHGSVERASWPQISVVSKSIATTSIDETTKNLLVALFVLHRSLWVVYWY